MNRRELLGAFIALPFVDRAHETESPLQPNAPDAQGADLRLRAMPINPVGDTGDITIREVTEDPGRFLRALRFDADGRYFEQYREALRQNCLTLLIDFGVALPISKVELIGGRTVVALTATPGRLEHTPESLRRLL